MRARQCVAPRREEKRREESIGFSSLRTRNDILSNAGRAARRRRYPKAGVGADVGGGAREESGDCHHPHAKVTIKYFARRRSFLGGGYSILKECVRSLAHIWEPW